MREVIDYFVYMKWVVGAVQRWDFNLITKLRKQIVVIVITEYALWLWFNST